MYARVPHLRSTVRNNGSHLLRTNRPACGYAPPTDWRGIEPFQTWDLLIIFSIVRHETVTEHTWLCGEHVPPVVAGLRNVHAFLLEGRKALLNRGRNGCSVLLYYSHFCYVVNCSAGKTKTDRTSGPAIPLDSQPGAAVKRDARHLMDPLQPGALFKIKTAIPRDS